MPNGPTRRHPKPDRRRALELIASNPAGVSEAILLAHGIAVELMVKITQAGLATAHGERMVAGKKSMEVARVRIAEAGRRVHSPSDYPHQLQEQRQ